MRLPERVRLVEVGPRDGFQNISGLIPGEVKLREIELLVEAGVSELEVTSFVHPKAIPQMADAAEVAREAVLRFGDRALLTALVPNARGAEKALQSGITSVIYVISVSEAHNKANVNRSVEESCAEMRRLISAFPELSVRLDAATVFGCPFEGDMPRERVFRLADRAAEYGVKGITLCDTIGVANPRQVAEISAAALARYQLPLGLHLHDTRGMGLANCLAGLLSGVSILETSVGGLGGCPFAPGAAGNTSSEDLLNMLSSMGIATGVDFEAYMRAVAYAREHIASRPLTGRMAYAHAAQHAWIRPGAPAGVKARSGFSRYDEGSYG
jgi:hydroxymethylglutaryl-CoA lyase